MLFKTVPEVKPLQSLAIFCHTAGGRGRREATAMKRSEMAMVGKCGSGIPAAGQRLDAKRGFRDESSDLRERQPSSTLNLHITEKKGCS
jgi:hypothetical protein